MKSNFKKLIWTLLLAGGVMKADVCGSIAGNVVANCGFESGDFSAWTLAGNLHGGPPPNNFYGVDNSVPHSGSYAAYFGVQGGGGTALGTFGPFLELSQTLNLLPSEYYLVSFYYDQDAPPSTGYVNYIDLRFGGVLRALGVNITQTSGYLPATLVVATSGDAAIAGNTLLQFDFQNDAGVFNFDDVSVTAIGPVPEPASWGFMAISGLAGLALLHRRRISS